MSSNSFNVSNYIDGKFFIYIGSIIVFSILYLVLYIEFTCYPIIIGIIAVLANVAKASLTYGHQSNLDKKIIPACDAAVHVAAYTAVLIGIQKI